MEEKVAVLPEGSFLRRRQRIEEETLRYLGYRGQNLDEQTQRMLHEVYEELAIQSLPQSICREYACKVEQDVVSLGPLVFHSSNLAKNLKSCEKVVLLAATIGRAADLLIQKYSFTNLAKAAMVQAAGAALIESYVDELEAVVREGAKERGFCLRPRFSPGYGDFLLDYQKDIFALLECSKRMGLTLSEGNLMMPSKSVTALIGLTKEERTFDKEGSCRQCESTDCEFRRTKN